MSEPPERPLGAYALLSAAFSVVFLLPLAVAARRRALPERPQAADIALLGVGTFKLSRLLARDAVTGFIRAPFVRYEGMESVTTPKESPRGRGLQRAVGQLLLCPQCTGLWVASASPVLAAMQIITRAWAVSSCCFVIVITPISHLTAFIQV